MLYASKYLFSVAVPKNTNLLIVRRHSGFFQKRQGTEILTEMLEMLDLQQTFSAAESGRDLV